jgi:hypothetical protein
MSALIACRDPVVLVLRGPSLTQARSVTCRAREYGERAMEAAWSAATITRAAWPVPSPRGTRRWRPLFFRKERRARRRQGRP